MIIHRERMRERANERGVNICVMAGHGYQRCRNVKRSSMANFPNNLKHHLNQCTMPFKRYC